MKVEIVSVGTPLLMSDIIDTHTAHVTRTLREIDVQIVAKVTVGDDIPTLTDVLRVAIERVDVVLVIGGSREPNPGVVQRAVAAVTGQESADIKCLAYGAGHTDGVEKEPGLFLPEASCVIICLPWDRRELAFVLENQVLPFLQKQAEAYQAPELVSGWIMLRTVGIMESSIRQRLTQIPMGSRANLTYHSFAGQTDVRLWTEAPDETQLQTELAALRHEILTRLGDHVYGEGQDRLEQVLLTLMAECDISLVVAECHTHEALAKTWRTLPGFEQSVEILPVSSGNELADRLHIDQLQANSDLTQWCRHATTALLAQSDANLGLVIYNNFSPGGTQVLVTLASSLGVSVTQRSFGGHPESIDQWACTLGLTHLRRWLLVHRPAKAT